MALKNLLMRWVILSLAGYSFSSYAQLPIDPTVIHGSAVFDTAGTHMTVINGPNTIINWQSFSIDTNHSVYFQQQDASSVVLNRVTGNDPSHIFGSLGSNGHIWLINPYGVFFSENARIDASGLVASTLGISNIDFLAKQYQFNSTSVTGEIKNQGEIHTTLGGRVWLIGNHVQNEGLIRTPGGQVVLAAGKTVEFVDSGAPNIAVRLKAPENEVVNLGALIAASGAVDLHGSIVNQEGIIRANSVGTDAAGNIVLKADQTTLAANSQTEADNGSVQVIANDTLNNQGKISGNTINLVANEILQQGEVKALGGGVTMVAATTYLDGLVDASNTQGIGGNIAISTEKLEGTASAILQTNGDQGGSIRIDGKNTIAFSSTLVATGEKQGGLIEVTGDKVFLLNANVDASGNEHGGSVYLGKAMYQGGSQEASQVLIGTGTEIKANGRPFADAKNGEIVVWSTQSTEFYGSLQVNNGGHAVLSSKGKILKAEDIVNGGNESTVRFDSKNLIISSNPPDSLQLVDKVFSGSLGGKPDLKIGDSFGSAVALKGNLLAVGAAGNSENGTKNQGAVYLFTGAGNDSSGLTLQKKLSSGIGATGMPALGESDYFGSAVALDGDHLAVGVKGSLLSESNPGAVHLFSGVGPDFSGLTWQKVLTSNSGAKNMPGLKDFDFFGTALALAGDRLLVGAAGDSTGGANRGAVHMFTGVGTDFSNLTWRGKLASGFKGMELSNNDFFGWSLALDGDKMVVGAFNDNAGGSHRGAVHLFNNVGADFANLTWRGKLTTEKMGIKLSDSDFFGWSVALAGDRMAVGAIGDDKGGKNHGAVYLLASAGSDFSGLKLENKITPDIKSATDGFGLSLALDSNRLAAGAIESSGGSGALYRFNWLAQNQSSSSPSGRQATVDTAIQSVNAATTGSRAVLDVVTDGRVLNLSTETSSTGFGRLNLAQMSLSDMQQLIDYRREFKKELLSEAIYKLELDPSLSEIPYCSSLKELDFSACRISDDQRKEAKLNIAKEQQRIHAIKHKAKIAVLPQIERKFIVLFGIDQYSDKSIPKLENTISDAEAVGQLFAERLGYEVRVIKNATKANVIQTLNQLSIDMEVNDSVVIYYAGHGFINEKTGNGYWIPSDASAKDPSTWISNTSISEMLANIRSKQMVMISDSCYSGAFTKEQKLSLQDQNVNPENILVKRSVVVMSSGGEEPVADEGRGGHSIFAWYLMQALRNVDNWKAGVNVFDKVRHDVSKSFPQTPQYGAAASAGHEKGGDYLFEFRQLE